MPTLKWPTTTTTTKPNHLPPPPRRRRRSADITRCRKHREQHQSPGVCSACLREKLSRLPSAATSSRTCVDASSSASSSASSYYSSSSSSSCASSCSSPRKGGGGGGILMSLTSQLRGKKNNRVTTSFMMSKSRSLGVGVDGGRDQGKVFKGFWSRVLRRRKPSTPASLGGRSITMRDVILIHA
ncbi:hypothetical protein LINGRAHAP2_LOCUS16214 [Linum grandiflorum]